MLEEVNAECGSHLRRNRLSLYGCVLGLLMVRTAGAVATARLHSLLLNLDGFAPINLNGTEISAIFELFERVKYITCTDEKYQFFRLSRGEEAEGAERPKGKCRQWAFAPDAPLPRFLLKFVPHTLSGNGRGRYLVNHQASAPSAVPSVSPPVGTPRLSFFLPEQAIGRWAARNV